jgi:hypothetical protein
MGSKSSNKADYLIRVLLGSVAFTFISFIADISEIISSSWFTTLTSSSAMRWAPYILNIVLSTVLIIMYRTLKSEHEQINKSLEFECRVHNSLWTRYVRTLRAIILDFIPTPNVRDTLEPLLDELAKKLPSNGVEYKIAVARPIPNGKFKILAERGMDPASVHSIEQKADWKARTSLFSSALMLTSDKPYDKYVSGEQNYTNIQRPTGVGSSASHFLVVINDPLYPDSDFPHNALGVLSIGIPKAHDFDEDDADLFYHRLFPIIKSIESILLNRQTIDKIQVSI